MELLRGIDKPLPGERPLQVVPPMAPYVRPEAGAGEVRRRLNLFAHRALTHVALTHEQRYRIGEAALLAQALSPGVIDGLEVALEQGSGATRLMIGPGHALTFEGLDFELAYPLRVDPYELPVHGETLAGWTTDADAALRARIANGDTIRLEELLPVVGGVRAPIRAGLVPHAMVLVAQPVAVALTEARGDVDACENATDAVLTPEVAWEDGFRLAWVPWPAARGLPSWSADGSTLDTRFRNRLAYAIFDDERRPLEHEGVRSVRRMTETRSPDDPPAPRRAGEAPPPPLQQPWPWEAFGVALSIVGFDGQFRPVFADRAAVVRQGGGRRNRAPLVRMGGDDVLWQARVAQMLEHVSELADADRIADRLVRHFERLPPTGLLPLAAVNFERKLQTFFPPNYDVQVQPVPIDMVDALMGESASLASYNLSAADQVQVLVPVPSRFFERDLLELDERIHPLFDIEIARLEEARQRLLRRRDALRRRIDLLSKAITGRLPGYPEDDPNALPDEHEALDAMAFARVRNVRVANPATAHWHGFTGAKGRLHLSEADALMVFVKLDAPVASLSVRVSLPGPAVAGVYWGERPVEAAASMVRAGGLPADASGAPLVNRWLRLTAPVSLLGRNASGAPVANPLAGAAIDNVEFGVLSATTGVNVTWGYFGTVSSGAETYWVADAWPPGASSAAETLALWGADAGGVTELENNSFGVSVDATQGTFVVDEIKTLYETFERAPGGLKRELGEAWARPPWTGRTPGRLGMTLRSPFPPLIEQGIDTLVERLGQRIAAADDHVEVGFLRARTDIFRLRQGVLGTAIAGRLLTSPAAAELVQRSESAVATEKVFAEYFARAKGTPPPVNP